MARPKTPLISRRSALEAALRIIDDEGLEALSIRRLGEELNVNGASFYHHFASKDDILVGVAQLALAGVRSPVDPDESWRDWLPRNARALRDALLAHPNLIPVLLRREGLGIGLEELERSAAILEDQGVPSHQVLPLIETLEVFALATALHEVNGTREAAIVEADDLHPALLRAHKARPASLEHSWDLAAIAIIEALEQSLALPQRKAPRKRPRATKPAKASA